MAIKALNSVAGFSVGEVPANIILANGDITSNNGTFTSNVSAGNVKTNNLLYANGTAWDIGGIPGGSNTQVQFNDIGDLHGSVTLQRGVAYTANALPTGLSITGANIAGTLDVTGNLSAGNIVASGGSGGSITGANLVSANFFTGTLTTAAQPNITSVGTLTSLDVTGNIAGGNLTTTGLVSATGNVSGGNLTTGGALSVTGNANVGNLGTGGLIIATGNISGGNLSTAGV